MSNAIDDSRLDNGHEHNLIKLFSHKNKTKMADNTVLLTIREQRWLQTSNDS